MCLAQALESEIVSHEPLIESVANTAHHMVEKNHYASSEVQGRLDHLQSQLQQLKDLAAQRKARLLDAVESQMVRKFRHDHENFPDHFMILSLLHCLLIDMSLFVKLSKAVTNVGAFQFYSEVAEAESWMNEKKPLLVSPDLGKDEDSVQVHGLCKIFYV